MHVAIIAERVGRNTGNRLFDEAHGQRVAYEEEFIRAIYELDASPCKILRPEAEGRLEKIAIEDRVIWERTRAAPEECTSPIPLGKRLVVHDRSGHAFLVLVGEHRFGAVKTPIRILRAPIFSWLYRHPHGPRIELALADFPAMLIRFPAMKPGRLDPEDAARHTHGDDIT